MTEIEYASATRSGLSAYAGLARWSGLPLEDVIEAAREDRLGPLVESRQFARPLSCADALRRLREKRYAPGEVPKSPAELVGELRALRASWLVEHEVVRRQCSPEWRLGEIYAKRQPPWVH